MPSTSLDRTQPKNIRVPRVWRLLPNAYCLMLNGFPTVNG